MKILLICTIFVVELFAQPFWIDSPTTSQYIGGVGIVKSKLDRRLAKIKARAALLESIKVEISSKSTLSKSNLADGQTKNSFSQDIIQSAKGALDKSYVKDTFVDDDGYFYIWVVIEK